MLKDCTLLHREFNWLSLPAGFKAALYEIDLDTLFPETETKVVFALLNRLAIWMVSPEKVKKPSIKTAVNKHLDNKLFTWLNLIR